MIKGMLNYIVQRIAQAAAVRLSLMLNSALIAALVFNKKYINNQRLVPLKNGGIV